MKKTLIMLVMVLSGFGLHGADLVEVSPVTNKILVLVFDDGYIKQHGYHESGSDDQSYLWPLNVERAENPLVYAISSEDDEGYSEPMNPLFTGRKSKGHDFSKKCINWNDPPWPGAACKNDYASHHYIYLELPTPLVSGKTYTIHMSGLADNMGSYTFTYDLATTRAISIHTNNFGYAPQAGSKYAYISQWMGTLGPLTDDGLIGNRFDLLELDANGIPVTSVFNGTVDKQKDYTEKDNNQSNQSPYNNYVVSNVYECDFSSFTQEGEYILVVEDVGASYPFRINADAYHEAFYWTMKGIYLERALIDAPEAYGMKWAHPAWEDADLVYTHVRSMDLTDESGQNQRQNIFENLDWSVDLTGIRGWYHDAGDWDGYFSHFRVPRVLMYTYELAPDNFSDGELDIPESQAEYNGYSGTHIPDILDEAVWLVDYFKNNVGPTGGIFGSRVHPDISTVNESLGITTDNYPDFTFRDCRIAGIPSWEDCTTWIVHGEDPRDSYAFASIAAQYAFNLGIAETRTGEDYTAIIAEYADSAISAYNWAMNNTISGDENGKQFVENRAAAAAWLYKLTGEQGYIDQLKLDLALENITASTTDPGESKWAVFAYATMDGTDPLYSGTFDATLQDDLRQVVKKYANNRVTDAIDANRSMRWGGSMLQPVWNGQATTPWILPAMVAKMVCDQTSDPDATKYMDACFTTNDYFLGGNQLNMVWLTYAGHTHTQYMLHHDSEYNPTHPGYIPGVPVYGPRTRCDWFAPGGDHPHAGDNCYYNNSHDADFALLDGRLFPAYNDAMNDLVWPVHELYFENYGCPPTNEFTVHQTIAPAAAAYGFVTASGGNAQPGVEPVISIATDQASYELGDEVTVTLSASDADGWIYEVNLYLDNRLLAKPETDQNTYVFTVGKPGTLLISAEAEDNLGLSSMSNTVEIAVSDVADAPSVAITNPLSDGLYRINEEITINATTGGQVDRVEFFYFNEKIGEDSSEPYSVNWTPLLEGTADIIAVAYDTRGLSSTNLKQVSVTSSCLTLLKPLEDEEFDLGSYVVVKAEPSECAGDISNVRFYVGYDEMEDDLPSPADGTYGVSFKKLEEGEYVVYAVAETTEGMLISDSIHFTVVDPYIGVENRDIKSLNVFPNPSDEGFNFRYERISNEPARITIYDATGRQVLHHLSEGSEDHYYWNASGMSPGVYTYTLVARNTFRKGKLIIN
mgnify:CR=1 FL=1